MISNGVIDKVSLARNPEQTSGQLSEVMSRVSDLSHFYPAFGRWIDDKVLPGLNAGDRSVLTEYRDGALVALAIVKDDGSEKKLCCLRVLPGYQYTTGIGVRLFERCFDTLKTEKPLLSVAEEQLPKFERIFGHFGFMQAAEYRDLYRVGAREFAFNGLLELPKRELLINPTHTRI